MVRKPELVPYYKAAQKLMQKFEHIEISHVPRSKNASADSLAKLASTLVLPKGKPANLQIEERWLLPAILELIPNECDVHHIVTTVIREEDWRKPFLDYFSHGILPSDPVERRRLQRHLPSYIYKQRPCIDTLSVKRSYCDVSLDMKLIKFCKRSTMAFAEATKVDPKCTIA